MNHRRVGMVVALALDLKPVNVQLPVLCEVILAENIVVEHSFACRDYNLLSSTAMEQ